MLKFRVCHFPAMPRSRSKTMLRTPALLLAILVCSAGRASAELILTVSTRTGNPWGTGRIVGPWHRRVKGMDPACPVTLLR